MAQNNGISLKVLVDKEKNRVIFAECDHDFIDILFSFLTIPLGTIIRLATRESIPLWIGCLSNLCKSVQTVGDQHFRSEGDKSMLLSPRNGAESHCMDLKLKIDGTQEIIFFRCCSSKCVGSNFKLCSYYRGIFCECGSQIYNRSNLSNRSSFTPPDGGVFVKLSNRYIVSDDLQVMVLCTATSFSLLSKSGVTDGSTVEERTFTLGVNEVLNLLMCSLVSNTPLTETLLNHKPAPELSYASHYLGGSVKSLIKDEMVSQEQYIYVKIFISKSKNMVCYAEAKKDFVNLLFSFLTVPLGHVVNQVYNGSVKGCVNQLYNSVHDLDEQCFNSNEHKEILCSPRVAPGFSYENDLLEIEEASPPQCYWDPGNCMLSTDWNLPCHRKGSIPVMILYSKSHDKDRISRGGFLKGLNLFTVTDNLVIRPVSSILGLSILNELKMPFSDIEERTVRVGKEEASRLLLSSFVSESALTNTFIKVDPNQIPVPSL